MHAKLLIAVIATLVLISPVQAKHRQHHFYKATQVAAISPSCVPDNNGHMFCGGSQIGHPAASPMGRKNVAPSNGWSMAEGVIGGRPSGCPHAYCGCWASLKIFGRIIPELNLASNWGRFPSASPAPGMAAYRHHHVFVIESVNSDGSVVASDGNSGRGLARRHTVSLRGYRVVNPNGQRYASRVTSVR